MKNIEIIIWIIKIPDDKYSFKRIEETFIGVGEIAGRGFRTK